MADPARIGGADGWWFEPHHSHYAVSDVYFGEICVISSICRNSWQLFSVARGEAFHCDFDEAGYHAVAAALRAAA